MKGLVNTSRGMVGCLIFFGMTFLNGYSQQVVELGKWKWTIPSTPFCIYHDNTQGYNALVETYGELKNDSAYVYDVWYEYNGKKGNVKHVWVSVGAIADIDTEASEIEENKASEGLCAYTLFIEEKFSRDEGLFYTKKYTDGSFTYELMGGGLIVFCNDRNTLVQIIEMIKKAQ